MSGEHFSVDGSQIKAWAGHKSMRRKDGSDDGRPPEDRRGERRSNETHESKTDPDAQLYRKSNSAPRCRAFWDTWPPTTATVWWSMGRRRRAPARPSATRRPRCSARLRCASSTSPSVPTRPQRRQRRAGKPTRAGCVSRGREGRRGGGQGGQPNAQLHREQPQDRDIVGMIDGIAFHTQHPRAERAGRGCRCRRTGGRLRGGRLGGSEPGAASRRCDLPGDAAIHRGSLPTPRSGPRQEPNPPGFEAKLIAAPGPVAIASATDD